MVDSVPIIELDDDLKVPNMHDQEQSKKTQSQKRKRAFWDSEILSSEQRDARIKGFVQEMEGLFGFYKEMMEQKSGFGIEVDLGLIESGSLNSVVAVLMEESDLPLSKLVEAIREKVKDRMGNVGLAAVKSALLYLGQRVKYGVGNEDADILEDGSSSSLWCWETRDAKLMPKSVRTMLKIRRTCRKKINERITAVSGMLTMLQNWENDQKYKHDFMKASEKLAKVFSEADIRLLMFNMSQKSGSEMAEKDAKREEKLLIKQLEKNKREMEKEKKKMDRELQKEKLRNEKETKRLKEEAEKDERQIKKQLTKQQEEAERDQRRHEKEETVLKKKLSIQKQASYMERFLKKCKTSPSQIEQPAKPSTFLLPTRQSDKVPEAVTVLMDTAFSSKEEANADDLRKLHLSSWRHLGHSIRSNKEQCWGIRRKPKTELFKELKLTVNKVPSHDELSVERIIDGWGEQNSDNRSSLHADISVPDAKKYCRRKQLLQFDKSYRPAFFGIWPTKSNVVGPRCPLRKDPDLDYDVDSDEEWEEEEPGESLSDCDKDEEEESLEGYSKASDDEDESEDGFFVPDGYLSENEGVQVDRMETDVLVEETKSSRSMQDGQNEEFVTLLRQQKYLNNLTEHALRKNLPLIISNLSHEKSSLLIAEQLSGTPKLEQTCLQALIIRKCPGGLPIEVSVDKMADDKQEGSSSSAKASVTPVLNAATISDSDMPILVSTIQSCSHGINRLVEVLQQKFPSISKSQLKSKVREISEFSDNRWQVKKEILLKLGMAISPERVDGRTKTIAAFFSKRCLPPSDKSVSPIATSPQLLKPSSTAQEQQGCTYKHS